MTTPQPMTIDSEAESIVLSVIQDWNEAMMFGKKEEDAISSIGAQAKIAITNLIAQEANKAVVELLERLYSKKRMYRDLSSTGYVEQCAIHHKDIDHEYWKLTGRTLQ